MRVSGDVRTLNGMPTPVTRRQLFAGAVVGLGALFSGAAPAVGATPGKRQVPLGPGTPDFAQLAYEATLFGMPLVLLEATRVELGLADPARPDMWTFTHVRRPADPELRSVVAPNVDTLYSSAWVNLARSPVRLSVPDTGDLFHLMQAMDCWSDVYAAPGTRTFGSGPYSVVLAREGQEVTALPGEQVFYCGTDWTWILGRTEITDPADLAPQHAIQDGYRLEPLTPDAPTPATPTLPAQFPGGTTPLQWVRSVDARTFLSLLGPLMAASPPRAADSAQVDRLRSIGVVPGEPFPAPSPLVAPLLTAGYQRAWLELSTQALSVATIHNGWATVGHLGDFGTDYYRRAFIAVNGLGANLPEDAVYLTGVLDAHGALLVGARTYRMSFAAGQLPPAGAFWSVTVYDADRYLVPNPLNRYALGDRDSLATNEDGSVDLIVGATAPADQQNWLPAPVGDFRLILRLYSPDGSVLSGDWQPPALTPLP